jgi:hypothetical protein
MILMLNQNIEILEYYQEQLVLISGSVMLPLIFY